MTDFLLLLAAFLVVLLALAWPLGALLARIGSTPANSTNPGIGPRLERGLLRLAGPAATSDQGWKAYATALIAFNAVGALFVYALQRLQASLPLNPEGMANVSPD